MEFSGRTNITSKDRHQLAKTRREIYEWMLSLTEIDETILSLASNTLDLTPENLTLKLSLEQEKQKNIFRISDIVISLASESCQAKAKHKLINESITSALNLLEAHCPGEHDSQRIGIASSIILGRDDTFNQNNQMGSDLFSNLNNPMRESSSESSAFTPSFS